MMHSRGAGRSALVALSVVAFGIGWALPAHAEEKGSSGAQMTIEVDCHSVEVTSSKDVSNVKVYFTDGTMVEIHPGAGGSFSATFEKTIDHATAKSGTTQVGDAAGDCGGDNDGDNGDVNGNGGGNGNGDGPGDLGADDDAPPNGGPGDGGPGGDDADDTLGGSETAADDTDDTDDTGDAALEVCPSGPHAGMPVTTIEDCGVDRDRVLSRQVLDRTAVAGSAETAAQEAGAAAAAEAALPATGPGTVLPIGALAALLMAAGWALVVVPRRK